ncbi:MAG: O-antigen ligase family protein [Patescibacteria group bacterium]
MESFFAKYYRITFWLIIIAEILSFIGHIYGWLNTVIFICFSIVVLLLSIWKIEYGFWIACTELFIGSFGYLFFYDVYDFRFSIRLAIFVSVFIGWIVYSIRNKKIEFFSLRITIPFCLFLGTLLLGAFIGFLRGNGAENVFFDINGYLYFGLMLVGPTVLTSWSKIKQLMQILFASVSAVCLKTFFLLFYFSHQTDENLIRLVYTWVRDTRVGEIAPIVSAYYRIFFQGHLWVLFALIIAIIILIKIPRQQRDTLENISLWLLAIATSTTIIISFSRSIWLALAVTIATLFTFLVWKGNLRLKKLLKISGFMLLVTMLDFLIITAIVNVHLPGEGRGGVSAVSLVQKRITTDEPAAKSRFQLLRPLINQYLENPIFGSGFAQTVSYQTLDPRTKDLNSGWYTTYSFEWGYLDILVKIGVVGLFAYLWLLIRILKKSIIALTLNGHPAYSVVVTGFIFCLIALVVTHATTPYLNHPLGILLIVLLAAIANPTLLHESQIKKARST